jgi:hypothetical protein
VFLVSGKVTQAALDAAAQVRRQLERRLRLTVLVLLQDLPHQGGFRPPGALGLMFEPAQQFLGQFHRQRFHGVTVTPIEQNSNTIEVLSKLGFVGILGIIPERIAAGRDRTRMFDLATIFHGLQRPRAPAKRGRPKKGEVRPFAGRQSGRPAHAL